MDLKEMTDNSNRHPWELSRAKAVSEILLHKNIHSFADIGAGDAYFAKLLASNKKVVYAIDNGYPNDREEQDGVVLLNSLDSLPDKSVDCCIMMDVLEHIEDDRAFLKQATNKLRDNGVVMITVPAFQFLFSNHDVFVKHYRRYNSRQLKKLIKDCNLKIERMYYFYTLLLVARLLSNFLSKNKK
jgi:2-polyprenyl-3-methyl-5-hydroxy-6-metoxy-1,4-benzoquinol methylase